MTEGSTARARTPAAAILLHGLGSRGADLADVAAALGPGLPALTPDLPGHGDAAPAPVASIAAIAGGLAPPARDHAPVLLAGFSFGAWVAIELWRAAPAAVAGVALVDPALSWDALWRWARLRSPTNAAARRKLLALYEARDVATAERLMRAHPLTRELTGPALRRNAQALIAADPAALQAALELPRPDLACARPPGSRAPVLVLHGSESIVCPGELARETAALLGGEAESVPGGHCAHLEAPAAVAAALRELAARAAAPA